MKKILLFITLLLSSLTSSLAHDGKPVTLKEMPVKAQEFVKSYFMEEKIALSIKENELWNNKYKIIFVNGNKVEFDSKGNWTEINCINKEIPISIIPKAIRKDIYFKYPKAKIVHIERNGKEFEIKLSNDIELTYDNNCKLIETDL